MSSSGEGDLLQERFELAAEHMRANSTLKLSNEDKLRLYGYFKQVKSIHVFFKKI